MQNLFLLPLIVCSTLAAPVLAAGHHGDGGDVVRQQQQQQQPASDEFEALKRALAQPGGGDARREREAAVDALLRSREARAHELLAAVIARGGDPDGTARFVMQSLNRIVTRSADTVFGDEALRSVMVGIYVPAIVRLWAAGDGAPPNDPTALLPFARRFFLGLSFRERRENFEAIVAGNDDALAAAALRAAGASRDIALGPWIAERLGDMELGKAAQDALVGLTFAEEPFADKAAFDTWFAQHVDADYTDLAEQAARRGVQVAERVRREVDARVVEQTAKLVAALVRSDAPEWKAIGAEVLGATSDAATARYLTVLRDALAERVASGARLGGVAADRLAFARELRLRLEQPGERPESYALRLETLAYLAVKDDTTQRQLVEGLLTDALRIDDAEVRRAAFRGLRRFPSPAIREQVVTACSAALGVQDVDTLLAGLVCLHAPGWSAPLPEDADREAWLLLLQQVLQSNELDVRAKENVLHIVVLRDTNGASVDAGFDLLLSLARAQDRDSSLRKQALPRLLMFVRDGAHADDYVSCAIDLLGDPDAGIRRLAARQLTTLPEATNLKRAEWVAQIVGRGAVRLREETDERALRDILDCLLRAAETPEVASAVLRALADTAKSIAANGASELAFRKDVIVDGLRILGVGPTREPAEWLLAADALVTLRARDGLLAVLSRQNIAEFANRTDRDIAATMRMVIAAARLKPDEPRWSDLLEEAGQVRTAFETLDRLGEPATDPADRALRVTVLACLDRPAEVIHAAETALADSSVPLGPNEQAAVLRVIADAHLRLAALDAAERRIAELDGLTPNAPPLLELWTRLAQARLTAGEAPKALEILARILPRTPTDQAAWCERFLLQAEARLAADSDANRASVVRDLQAESARFTGDVVTAELASRYTTLLRRAQGQG